MSIFEKKTSTHFERDKAGRVINVTRSGDMKELTREEQFIQPRKSRMKENIKAAYKESKKLKKERRDAYRGEYQKAAIKESRAKARRTAKARYQGGGILAGLESGFSGFDSGYPQTRKKSSKHKTTKNKAKYAVVSGKAYPIAQKKSSKRKTTKKRKTNTVDDLFHAGNSFF